MKSKTLISGVALLSLAFTAMPVAFAGDGSSHMSDVQHRKSMGGVHHPEDGQKHADAAMMQADMKGMFLVKKDIDGYQVSFHIMEPKEGAQHGGPHSFMIRIEKNGKVITDAIVNSRAVHPVGASESKMMMKMGDWYMAGYDLGHEGQHHLMVLFKTADGKKHSGSVDYPAK